MSISNYFHKAKREAKTSKAKTLIDQFHETSKSCSYGKISEQEAEQKMRQLLFKNGYPVSDFDVAKMQAVQIKAMQGFQSGATGIPMRSVKQKPRKESVKNAFTNPYNFAAFNPLNQKQFEKKGMKNNPFDFGKALKPMMEQKPMPETFDFKKAISPALKESKNDFPSVIDSIGYLPNFYNAGKTKKQKRKRALFEQVRWY